MMNEGKRFIFCFCFLWHSYGRGTHSITTFSVLFLFKKIPEARGEIRREVNVFFLTAFFMKTCVFILCFVSLGALCFISHLVLFLSD